MGELKKALQSTQMGGKDLASAIDDEDTDGQQSPLDFEFKNSTGKDILDKLQQRDSTQKKQEKALLRPDTAPPEPVVNAKDSNETKKESEEELKRLQEKDMGAGKLMNEKEKQEHLEEEKKLLEKEREEQKVKEEKLKEKLRELTTNVEKEREEEEKQKKEEEEKVKEKKSEEEKELEKAKENEKLKGEKSENIDVEFKP